MANQTSDAALTHHHVEQLRDKLLDLSNRNPLLNFNHTPRSRTHVRIIDEVPEFLFAALSEGKELAFQSLGPEPSSNDAEGEKLPQFTPEAAARNTGYDSSYDLPALGAEQQARHADRFVQTLLFDEAMGRKLGGIRKEWQTGLSERGVHTLYAAFGFLEWYESPASTRALYAPLVLHPLEMERKLVKGNYEFSIRSTGEESLINLTLASRLRRDFRLVLPQLGDEAKLDAYLDTISEVVAAQPRWRIRRFVTVGIYGFARLVMHSDLEAERWPEGEAPSEHALVRQLLSERAQGEFTTADEYSLDDAPHVDVLPALVTSADSSQTSAIVDVLKGKDLALKGPPGTGKSQTITNLIAAAMHQGKSVLFVAEKMAALEVVQNRLMDAGLGDFCLELHSTHAKKTAVLDRIRKRIQLQNGISAPQNIGAHRGSLRELRERLNRYVRAWNSPAGHAGLTVHDAVWKEQSCREIAQDIASLLGDLRMTNAGKLSADALADLRAKGGRLADAATNCARADGRAPLWSFVRSESVSVLDIPGIVQQVEHATMLLQGCARALTQLDVDASRLWTLEQARSEAVAVAELPGTGVEQPLLATLMSPLFRAAVEELVAHLASRSKGLAALSLVSLHPEQLAEAHASFTTAAGALQGDAYGNDTLGSLGAHVVAQERELALLSAGREDLRRVWLTLGIEPDLSPQALNVLARAQHLLSSTSRRVLLARVSGVIDEQSGPKLAAAKEAQDVLRERERALNAELNLKSSPDAHSLRMHAVQLRTARWYSWFSGAFRTARALYLLLARGKKVAWTAMADRLDAAAEIAEQRQALHEDARLRDILGAHFHGADSDFENLCATNAWAVQVRQQLAGSSVAASRLRRALLSDSVETLDEITGCLNEAGARRVAQWVAQPGSEGQTLDEELARRKHELDSLRTAKQTLDALPLRGDTRVRSLAELAAAAQAVRHSASAIDMSSHLAAGLGSAWAGRDTDESRVRATLALSDHIRARVQSLDLREELVAARGSEVIERRRAQAKHMLRELDGYAQHQAVAAARGIELARVESQRAGSATLAGFTDDLTECLRDREALSRWVGFVSALRTARQGGLAFIVDSLESSGISLSRVGHVLEWAYHRSLIANAFATEPVLTEYAGLQVDEARRRFRELDEQLAVLERQEVAAYLCARKPPSGVGTGPRQEWTERALIENELAKKMRHVPIRQLVGRAGGALQALTPCFLMSPISVAQYLPPGGMKFDLLVIDEASQMRVEDAIGALSRAKQVVVVGDPKQLPPSSFFQSSGAEDEESDSDLDEPLSAESILDCALTAFQPSRDLRWHYRSKHESLIAFSNHHFYDNRLQIFPSPEPNNAALGVKLRVVRGTFQSSINEIEAREVAETAVRFMEDHPERSLGVVAMNKKQTDLIEDYIDELARTRTRAEIYRTTWSGGLEPFFVKNLENVQGDERDTIIIGMTYGPDPKTGRVFQRFGPINGASGHRRLNVLFTRAKERVVVISSMTANDIIAAENSSLGVRALKAYLQYAKDGLLEGGETSARAPDSPFEEQVIEVLSSAGYEAVPQVGVRGFFIDIGIKHPSYPHGYLCGVECDGASYHSSRTARDRDRLREDILKRLGWRLVRIWSTDWFADPRGGRARLIAMLDEIRAALVDRGDPLRVAGE